MNISAAAGFLGVVEAVLTDAEPPLLDAAALLGIFQLLRRVLEVEVQEVPEDQLVVLEQLGQHYVEVAGRVLEAESSEEWAEIQPVKALGGFRATRRLGQAMGWTGRVTRGWCQGHRRSHAANGEEGQKPAWSLGR